MQSTSPLPIPMVRSFRVRAPRAGPHPLVTVLALVLLLESAVVAIDAAVWEQPGLAAAMARLQAAWPAALRLGSPAPVAATPAGPVVLPPRVPLDPPAPGSAPEAAATLRSAPAPSEALTASDAQGGGEAAEPSASPDGAAMADAPAAPAPATP